MSRRCWLPLWILLICGTAASAQDPSVMRTATLAPEGSSWLKLLTDMSDQVKERTGGRVVFRYFPGGVAGDEKLVVRKLRVGQLHAAVFTNVGLGELLPEARILDIPFLYRTHEEIDRVRALLQPRFEQSLAERGYIVLGWSDAGSVYLYSGNAIRNLPDLRKRKVWVWEGDPVAEATFRAAGVEPIPLAFPDVLTALQSEMVDTVYVSPIACVGLQWFTRVKTMTDLPILDAVTVTVITKQAWEKLPPEDQRVVLEVTRAHHQGQVAATRKENLDSIRALQEQGVEVVKVDESVRAEFDRIADQVCRELSGKVFPAELLQDVQRVLAECRAGK